MNSSEPSNVSAGNQASGKAAHILNHHLSNLTTEFNNGQSPTHTQARCGGMHL